MQCLDNLLLNTDSYKASHWLQYPPGTDATFFYVESRGGLYDRTLFFGLQAILKEYLAKPITHADVDEARDVFAAHGEPFNEAGWRYIVDRHGGHLPIRIRAVPEGTVVPTHQALVTIESTDPDAYWVPSYLETMLLRLWYPVTVATISWHAKQTIRQFLERTSDDPVGQLPFKLHDFGARGVSSAESAALGGSAHLVNFMGTDTVSGLLAARAYYHEPMAGFSIPAAEHSTITSWGRENEVEAYRNMLRQFAKPGSVVAVVSDSYDIYHAIREHWGKTLKDEVIQSGATLVVRPDSGDPVDVVHQCLVLLDEAFGHTVERQGLQGAEPRSRDPGRRHQPEQHPRHPRARDQRRIRHRQPGLRHGRRDCCSSSTATRRSSPSSARRPASTVAGSTSTRTRSPTRASRASAAA